MESILTSTKQILGITEEYEHFDVELIMYINSVFLNLKQIGVGPSEGFVISDATSTWDEFIPDNKILRESVKAYVGAKTKIQFDPPTIGTAMDSLKRIIDEFEWRLNVEVESTEEASK